MKTFYELDTLPKVGDLIMRQGSEHIEPIVVMITNIIGDTYHTSKAGYSMHIAHLRSYYSPLGQEIK